MVFFFSISLVFAQLIQLKADLNDLIYSSKWTPEAFLIAKGYVSSDKGNTRSRGGKGGPKGSRSNTGVSHGIRHASSLPAISNHSERRPLAPYAFPRMLASDVQLPALKPKAHNPAGRQRDVQAVQRARHPRYK